MEMDGSDSLLDMLFITTNVCYLFVFSGKGILHPASPTGQASLVLIHSLCIMTL